MKSIIIRRAKPAKTAGRHTPFFIAIALFWGLMGSFLSMLQWEFSRMGALFEATFSFYGLSDGFALVFNRLFIISEQNNAYRYVMFNIGSPESAWDGYIAVALIYVAVLFALLSTVIIYLGKKSLVAAVFLLIVFAQVYFGVFPSAGWNIVLFATLALILAYRNIKGQAVAIAGIALVAAVLGAVYPGENLALSEFSESIRDNFDTRISQITGTPIITQDMMIEYDQIMLGLNVAGVQEDTLHESPVQDYYVEYYEIPRGAEIGIVNPDASILPMILVFIAIVLALAGVHFVPRLWKAAKRRKGFDLDDCTTAIDNMFVYMLEWLAVHGLIRKNVVFSAYAPELASLISPEYSEEYEHVTALWQKAMYSSHPPGEAERQRVKDFLNKTMTVVWKNSGAVTKMKIKLEYFL